MEEGEFSSTPLEELITMRLCPAFLVPQRPLFNRCLPKITFPKAVIVTAEEENEVEQNATTGSLSTGNNVTETLDNLDPTFVDYEGSWDVGAGKELEEDALILPRPNTVLKIVDLMKDRAKR